MTSLSKPSIGGKRTIKVKPVLVPHETPETINPSSIHIEEEINARIEETMRELEELNKQKEVLVHQTKLEIEKAREYWETEKQTYIESAKTDGYQIGFNEGKEKALQEYRTLIEQANAIVDSSTQDYYATIEKYEETIIELATHTAEKILKQRLEVSPHSFLPIVKSAIRELKDQSVISIFLHPVNYQIVLEQKGELLQVLEDDVKLAIYVNDEIQENGCVIKHPFGQMDVGIDTQLHELRDILHEISRENGT